MPRPAAHTAHTARVDRQCSPQRSRGPQWTRTSALWAHACALLAVRALRAQPSAALHPGRTHGPCLPHAQRVLRVLTHRRATRWTALRGKVDPEESQLIDNAKFRKALLFIMQEMSGVQVRANPNAEPHRNAAASLSRRRRSATAVGAAPAQRCKALIASRTRARVRPSVAAWYATYYTHMQHTTRTCNAHDAHL